MLDILQLRPVPSYPLDRHIVFLREKVLQLFSSQCNLKSQLQRSQAQLITPNPAHLPLKGELQQLLWHRVKRALPPTQKIFRKSKYRVCMLV